MTILLADDSIFLGESLQMALQAHFEQAKVIFTKNKDEFKNELNNEVSIVVLDIQFMTDNYDGIELAKLVKSSYPETKILMLSQYVKLEYQRHLIEEVKVDGYLDKQNSLQTIIDSITSILDGNTVIDPTIAELILSNKWFRSSPRETEVLELLEIGHTQQMVANELFISPRTVEGHVLNLRTRFSVKTTAELLVLFTKYKSAFREDGQGSNAPFLK